jgi:16S rRNA A1518/A1519 N6-dimethyltransferase RsmA/KsgA/DIM1 with predicted DNA glycosylase/AP lyase activity
LLESAKKVIVAEVDLRMVAELKKRVAGTYVNHDPQNPPNAQHIDR